MKTLKDVGTGNLTSGFVDTLKDIGQKSQEIDLSRLEGVAAELGKAMRKLQPLMGPFLYVSMMIGLAGTLFGAGAIAMASGIKALDGSAKLLEPAAIKLFEGAVKLQDSMPVIAAAAISMIATGILMSVGSAAFLSGTVILFAASLAFVISSAIFAAGSAMLYGAALLVNGGVNMLAVAARTLLLNSIVLAEGLASLSLAAFAMLGIGAAMLLGGAMLLVGSFAVLGAALSLSIAFAALGLVVTTYTSTIDKLAKLGEGLKLATTGVQTMFSATISGVSALSGLTSALNTELDAVIVKLNEYATAFEETAIRISEAVNKKIVPAMKAATSYRGPDTVQVSSIVSSPILTPEGGVTSDREELTQITQEANQEDGKQILEQIYTLLQTVLPEIADKSGRSFGTNMSGW
jgi:hypothetical protein